MKNIVASILLLGVLVGSAFSLSSCGKKSHIPSGMQVVAGGKELGYYFYAPEEWTISNIGDIKAAYVSRVDNTSVTFVEVEPLAHLESKDGVDPEEYFFNSYFNDLKREFPDSFTCSNPEGTPDEPFGKLGEEADRTKKYVYSYTKYDSSSNKNVNIGVIQILLMEKDKDGNKKFYIFTFTALHEKRTSNQTYYEFYLGTAEEKGKLIEIIDSFRFLDQKTEAPEKEYVKDKDGYILISDSAYSGYDLYVPEKLIPDEHASIFVSASYDDGSNINMTEASETGVKTVEYMKRKIKEIELFSGSRVTGIVKEGIENCIVRDENGEITDVIPRRIKFGNADAANLYEYQYTYNGEVFYVYQVLAVEGTRLSADGYMFTYTAKKDNYNLHLEDIEKICSKVKFK